MKPITLTELVSAVHGELLQGGAEGVTGVSTDSRGVREGELFLPIVGETFDGHRFIDSALAAGAAGCLCAETPETLLPGKFYVRVADTTTAYKDLAAWYRSQFDIPMVQVTGSVGKTTTKEMIAAVLSQRFRTLKTEANYNNEIGTPMTLLRLDDSYEAAVIETGMDRAGQIRYLGEMVKPTVAVITNIGDMHIEYLGSREGIFRAKCEIFEHLAPYGLAVLNGDDEWLNRVCLPQMVVTVGTMAHCAARVTEVADHGIDGVTCVVTTERARYALSIPAPGAHMIYPAATAVAVGEALGLSADELIRGVAAYEPAGSRMRVVKLPGSRRLLDDCYNAGPQSMRAALEVLSRSEGGTVAVLGDMAELGELTVPAHREMGELAKSLGIGKVIAIGCKAKDLADTANGDWYATVDEALPAIRAAFAPDTAMLVKASHSMHFERITEELQR
ncbi:MAG: UDP-N-acetylmuramoyl-tripeptide--D-alanyl-D-alanine ligase [Oscillospiraceae bacterium]|nr:UDP-N-acetylmuramoyl-tripeptide--D-alanyl-D-alanine ligase [Oscillospiraceae bacterium]